MTVTVPRQQPLVDANGHPSLPYARFFDRLASESNASGAAAGTGIRIPVPEDYGAVGDDATDDTAAMLLFFANTQKFGWLTPGKTYLVDSDAISIPTGTKWFGDKTSVIKNADADNETIRIAADDVHLQGFTVDGGNSAATIAAGYDVGHFGVAVVGASGNLITDVSLTGLTVKNCGNAGIDLYFADGATVERCTVSRCGYTGISMWSSVNVWVKKNVVSNIYPGDNPGNTGTNCYGIVASRYSSDSVRPAYIWIVENNVSDVVWEGIDEHDAQFCWIKDNRIGNCGTGVAVQHDETGYPARKITVSGNFIVGFGLSRTVDAVTYYSLAGIVCVGAVVAEQGQLLSVSDNTIESCGDTRTVSGDGGAITLQNWKIYSINGNRIYVAYKHGIICWHSSTDSNLSGNISGNTINETQTVGGAAKDIYMSGRSAALVTANIAVGNGNGFSQAGAPTYASSITGNYLFS